MRRLSVSVAVALLVFSFFAMQTFAFEGSKTGQSDKFSAMTEANRASKITGATVFSRQGEEFGKVNDLVIGQDGRVQYMILSYGGVMGVGDKLVPIPWRAVSPGTKENTFSVNVDKDKLARAPSFDPNNWPNFADPSYDERIFSYYGLSAAPRGTAESDAGMRGTTPESSGSRSGMDAGGEHKSMQPSGATK